MHKGKRMRIAAIVIVLGLVALMVWVRLAPIDPADWHTDPALTNRTGPSGWMLRPAGGDGVAPVFATDAATLLTALDEIALATPRTRRLAGTPAEGRVTYVTRSALMGYPDLTTVAVATVPGGVSPVIYARQRIGSGDWGVNRARVEAWMAALQARLAP